MAFNKSFTIAAVISFLIGIAYALCEIHNIGNANNNLGMAIFGSITFLLTILAMLYGD